ncbi:MAG: HigA family addiction module antitoxin [bacterium]
MATNRYNPESYTHPGAVLREKLEEIGMGKKEFALRTGKPEKTIHDILNQESSITPDMAVQFENVLKIPAKFWLNYQTNYNEAKARIEKNVILNENLNWHLNFPYNDMANRGWVPKTRVALEKVENLLQYFGFSHPKAWERYYFECELKSSFRISLKHIKEPYAVSAWLRHGEIEAEKIEIQEYNERVFKEELISIKSLVVSQPNDSFQQLRTFCAEAGVKIIYTPCLPKAPISGCTRWINDFPVIQLSGRYKKNDIFWFTFFHEAGHVLSHEKKEVFIEGFVENEIKEKEADEFASNILLSQKQENEIVNALPLNDDSLVNFAQKFNTHPAIIIGRLQHLYHRFTFGNDYRVDINFQ